MKRKVIILLLIVLFIIPVLSACESTKYSGDYMSDPEGLDSKVVLKMRKDYRQFLINTYGKADEWKLEDIWIQQYFGNYSGCEVVYMGDNRPHTDAEHPAEIAEYTIVFPNGQEVYAYKDSKFYTLKEAFDTGFISKDDVYDIAKKVGIDFKNKQNSNDFPLTTDLSKNSFAIGEKISFTATITNKSGNDVDIVTNGEIPCAFFYPFGGSSNHVETTVRVDTVFKSNDTITRTFEYTADKAGKYVIDVHYKIYIDNDVLIEKKLDDIVIEVK